MDLRPRSLVLASLLGLGLLLAACGGSSSTASSSTSTTAGSSTSVSVTPPTSSIPSASQVVAICQTADNALQAIGNTIQSQGSNVDYAADASLITSALGPTENCIAAMEAAIPGLPAAAQGPARDYVAAVGPVLDLLKAPPTSASAVAPWIAQIGQVAGPVQSAKAALGAADPTFAD